VLHRSPTKDVATVDLRIAIATEAEAAAIAGVRNAAADRLTREHGRGHWSAGSTER
jgi:hypothetical protein